MYILKNYYNGHASIVCCSKYKKDIINLLRSKGFSYCKDDDTYNRKTGYKKYDTCKIEQVDNIKDITIEL